MIDKEKVKKLQKFLSNPEIKKSLEKLRAISGSSRFKIISLLRYETDGLNVSSISKILNSSLSKISHQLTILKKQKIITGVGKNRETIYKMNDHELTDYLNCIM